jgi:hypothetical protein
VGDAVAMAVDVISRGASRAGASGYRSRKCSWRIANVDCSVSFPYIGRGGSGGCRCSL